MLKLPKNILIHPKLAAIEAHFQFNARLLRTDGKVMAPQWPFSDLYRKSLLVAFNGDQTVQGLESISKSLDKEKKGLKALQKMPGQNQNDRLSRLIILSNDGSERFYHDAESIVLKHAERTFACIVDATAEQLGESFSKKSKPTKALMINDRKALESFLTAIALSL